jgi:hypothetical protein
MISLYRKYGAAWFSDYCAWFGSNVIGGRRRWGYQPGNFVSPTFIGDYMSYRALVEKKGDTEKPAPRPLTPEEIDRQRRNAKQSYVARMALLRDHPKSAQKLLDGWDAGDDPNDVFLRKVRVAIRRRYGYVNKGKERS